MLMTYNLILLRHGNSEWNQKNLFTGWVDVDLTEQGIKEAKRAGDLLTKSGLKPDVLYTSVLKRAINTAHLALNEMDRNWIDTKRSWRLNERHYGSLQGLDKAETLENMDPSNFRFGAEATTSHHHQLMTTTSTRRLMMRDTPALEMHFLRPSA